MPIQAMGGKGDPQSDKGSDRPVLWFRKLLGKSGQIEIFTLIPPPPVHNVLLLGPTEGVGDKGSARLPNNLISRHFLITI